MSRPTIRTNELEDDILSRIACGESLRGICAEDGMPNISTVIRWLAADEDFARKYTRAREMQAEILADEMLDIADNDKSDRIDIKDKDGKTYHNMRGTIDALEFVGKAEKTAGAKKGTRDDDWDDESDVPF